MPFSKEQIQKMSFEEFDTLCIAPAFADWLSTLAPAKKAAEKRARQIQEIMDRPISEF